MIYKIRYIGDPVLRKKAEKITVFDRKLQSLIDQMTEIMYKEDGIGLAATQIGVVKQLLIIDITPLEESEFEGAFSFINPEILESEGKSTIEEGCLSVPDVREEVTRPERIRVKYQDRFGKTYERWFDGWMARVLQHEIDHLNGILFVDHLSPFKRQLLINNNAIPAQY